MRSALPMNLKGDFPNFKVWTRAQADIDRITGIWRECHDLCGGPFLLGERSMADALSYRAPGSTGHIREVFGWGTWPTASSAKSRFSPNCPCSLPQGGLRWRIGSGWGDVSCPQTSFVLRRVGKFQAPASRMSMT
jgi:hypothetical protein